MSFKVALVGNPNSGKTTLFNELTGSTQYVGNWPGVTVEKKEGVLKDSKEDITVIDLPGIYSLSPYTPEEIVSRNFILKEKPDVILNIIDSTNIERNLYLTLQLLETQIPVIIALNMMDVIAKRGENINVELLSKKLSCPIIETSAVKGTGFKEITDAIISIKNNGSKVPDKIVYGGEFEKAVMCIEEKIGGNIKEFTRWYALKLFEKDANVAKELNLGSEIMQSVLTCVSDCERVYKDDCESIIADLRYDYILNLLDGVYKRKEENGATVSEKIDRIVTNRFLAIPIFFLIMWGIYFISIQVVGGFTSTVMDAFFSDIIGESVRNFLININTSVWLQGFVVDGIIGGISAVLVFLPQLTVLFLCLSVLEDSGYMSRVAFIMDRIFRSFGLSGKSFIPMVVGAGCSVPGIMASRTIENDKNRKMTIMLTPFIPCAAKLPVFALIAGAVLPGSSLAAPSMYFAGIVMVIISGLLLKGTKHFKTNKMPFVMELPDYRLPKAKGLFIHMWERIKDFIVRAGTVIFAASAIIWLLVNFNWSLQTVSAGESILASLGSVIAPLFKPLGFGNWQSVVAMLSGYAAKENIVATLDVIFKESSGGTAFLTSVASLFENPAAGYAFMLFILFSPPCIAAIAALGRELGSKKWTVSVLLFQIAVAYITAFTVYQVASIFLYGGTPYTTFFIAFILLSITALIIFRQIKNKNSCGKCNGDCSKCKK